MNNENRNGMNQSLTSFVRHLLHQGIKSHAAETRKTFGFGFGFSCVRQHGLSIDLGRKSILKHRRLID